MRRALALAALCGCGGGAHPVTDGGADGGASPFSFSAPLSTDVPFAVDRLLTADFDKDGKVDVALASSKGGATVLLGKGDGTFKTPTWTANDSIVAMAAADFDADGKLDLAVAESTGVLVLLGDGKGSFDGNQTLTVNASDIAARDLDGDGHGDIVAVGPDGLTAILYGVDQHATYPFANALALAGGDFDGDGKWDFAVGGLGAVGLFHGSGGTGFVAEPTASVAAYGLAGGDFNGDRKLDVVAASDRLVVLAGDGAGDLTAGNPVAVGSAAGSRVAAADFDGDGKLDAAAVSGSAVGLFRGDGQGGLVAAGALGAGSDVAVADLDGDGKPDLATADGKTVSVFLDARK